MENYLEKLQDKWEVVDETRLRRIAKFPDFKTAMEYVNRVAEVSEQQQHHPDMHIHHTEVIFILWTQDVDALTEKDFALANAIEEILSTLN